MRLLVAIALLIWLLLMLRSVVAEYQYYQSVRTLEPAIWEKLGSPAWLKIPMVFVSPKHSDMLRGMTNPTVRQLAVRHRAAGYQFLAYVVLVLGLGIAYFKFG